MYDLDPRVRLVRGVDRRSAGRDRDIPDIAVLCQALGIDAANGAADIAFELDSLHVDEEKDPQVPLSAGALPCSHARCSNPR